MEDDRKALHESFLKLAEERREMRAERDRILRDAERLGIPREAIDLKEYGLDDDDDDDFDELSLRRQPISLAVIRLRARSS